MGNKEKKTKKKKYRIEISFKNQWGDILDGYIDENGKIVFKSKWFS